MSAMGNSQDSHGDEYSFTVKDMFTSAVSLTRFSQRIMFERIDDMKNFIHRATVSHNSLNCL